MITSGLVKIPGWSIPGTSIPVQYAKPKFERAKFPGSLISVDKAKTINGPNAATKKIIQAKIVVGTRNTPNLEGGLLIPFPPTVTNLCHFLTTDISTNNNIIPIKLSTIASTATTPDSFERTLEYSDVESNVYLAGVPKI